MLLASHELEFDHTLELMSGCNLPIACFSGIYRACIITLHERYKVEEKKRSSEQKLVARPNVNFIFQEESHFDEDTRLLFHRPCTLELRRMKIAKATHCEGKALRWHSYVHVQLEAHPLDLLDRGGAF